MLWHNVNVKVLWPAINLNSTSRCNIETNLGARSTSNFIVSEYNRPSIDLWLTLNFDLRPRPVPPIMNPVLLVSPFRQSRATGPIERLRYT